MVLDIHFYKKNKKSAMGGSGSYAIKNTIQAGTDAFDIDLKYHQF
jgi:hypothetical protein